MGKLPEYQRTVVHLHYIEGYSTQEISQIMNCRPATVRTWLFRARNSIKNTLDADSEAIPEQVVGHSVAEPDAIG